MNKFRKGDEVIVIIGKDAGKTGMIIAVQLADNGKVAKVKVKNIAIQIKHQKPNPQAGVEGGRISQEAWVDISNVMHVDANGKPSRVGISSDKKRVLKTTGAIVAQ
jgi:large subunit ribosomal protein L24